MSLDNLVGISLERISTDKLAIQRLLQAAVRNLQDAKLNELSTENQFDLSYKAVMQLSNVALQACGYRTLTSKPGHHQTMIQILPKTVGIDIQTMIILDGLRKQRNVIDYSGDLVSEKMSQECLAQAESLLQLVQRWLKQHYPHLCG